MLDLIKDINIIDADTHVIEPADLWTSQLSAKWGDETPHVRWDNGAREEVWYVANEPTMAVGEPAMAGFEDFPPSHPKRFADLDPTLWDAKARLALMDEYGIHAQVLYPNLALFNTERLIRLNGAELQFDIIRVYNDWQTEWSSAAPNRLIPIASLPFWDLDKTISEMERCAGMGHRGVTFTQNPRRFGLPHLDDRHWDRLWAAAQAMELPINFHIGTGDTASMDEVGHPDSGKHALWAAGSMSFFLSNAKTMSLLIAGGVCHRFPRLNFVSVESGVGWIPYVMAALDWQWKNSGVREEHPEYDLLPSEYFKRQMYGCFWFESSTALHAVEELGADNILFESDFPHPTSMSPGPASTALAPNEYVSQQFGHLPETVLRKLLHDNAARLYKLP